MTALAVHGGTDVLVTWAVCIWLRWLADRSGAKGFARYRKKWLSGCSVRSKAREPFSGL